MTSLSPCTPTSPRPGVPSRSGSSGWRRVSSPLLPTVNDHCRWLSRLSQRLPLSVMADRARTTASAARYGFTDVRAEGQLRAAGWWDDAGPIEPAADVLSALSRTADPDLALRGLDRIREPDERGWRELDQELRANRTFRGRLLGVLGTSSALADFVAAHPLEWRALTGKDSPDHYLEKLRERLTSGGAIVTGYAAEQALRAGYRALLLGIAAADLGHLVETGLEHPGYAEV